MSTQALVRAVRRHLPARGEEAIRGLANAAAALARSGDLEAIPVLLDALVELEDFGAFEVVWRALEDTRYSKEALVEAVTRKAKGSRAEMGRRVLKLKAPGHRDHLVAGLKSNDPDVVRDCLDELVDLRDARAIAPLEKIARRVNRLHPIHGKWALQALARLGTPEAHAALARAQASVRHQKEDARNDFQAIADRLASDDPQALIDLFALERPPANAIGKAVNRIMGNDPARYADICLAGLMDKRKRVEVESHFFLEKWARVLAARYKTKRDQDALASLQRLARALAEGRFGSVRAAEDLLRLGEPALLTQLRQFADRLGPKKAAKLRPLIERAAARAR